MISEPAITETPEPAGAGPRPGKILFIEPHSGISGDMFLAALLDLGVDFERLENKLRMLPLGGYRLSLTRCRRAGIQAARFDVACGNHHHGAHDAGPTSPEPGHGHEAHDHHHRSFRDIRCLIEGSGLSEWVRRNSIATFRLLAEAEGKIHGQPPDEVHFHEVGAVDSIVDIVGAMAALEDLQPVRLVSAAVNVGQGDLECRHGRYPAPGPAALEILRGVPVYAGSAAGEVTTPTGAALLRSLCAGFGLRPLMTVERIGYGAGAREIPGLANVLRVTLGAEAAGGDEAAAGGQVAVIEAAVDDMSPQLFGHFQEKALAAGALDVYAVAAQMKKNRPGMKMTVVCHPDPARIDLMTRLLFAETTTIGVRYYYAGRRTLAREIREVGTEYGTVAVKVSFLDGRRVNFAPEYEDCRLRAKEHGAALKDVMAAAVRAFLEIEPGV